MIQEQIQDTLDIVEGLKNPKLDFTVITAFEVTEAMNTYQRSIETLSDNSIYVLKNLIDLNQKLSSVKGTYELILEEKIFTDKKVSAKRSKDERRAYAEFLVKDNGMRENISVLESEIRDTKLLSDVIKDRASLLSKEKAAVLKQWDMVKIERWAEHKTDLSIPKKLETSTSGFNGEVSVVKPVKQIEDEIIMPTDEEDLQLEKLLFGEDEIISEKKEIIPEEKEYNEQEKSSNDNSGTFEPDEFNEDYEPEELPEDVSSKIDSFTRTSAEEAPELRPKF